MWQISGVLSKTRMGLSDRCAAPPERDVCVICSWGSGRCAPSTARLLADAHSVGMEGSD